MKKHLKTLINYFNKALPLLFAVTIYESIRLYYVERNKQEIENIAKDQQLEILTKEIYAMKESLNKMTDFIENSTETEINSVINEASDTTDKVKYILNNIADNHRIKELIRKTVEKNQTKE